MVAPSAPPKQALKRAASPVERAPRKAPNASAPRDPKSAAGDDSDGGPGEFEDPWEDEYESEDAGEEPALGDDDSVDEEIANTGTGVGGMDIDDDDDDALNDEPMAYLPGLGQGRIELDEDEELVPDLSSYVVLHHARLQWPCLSFDVLRDNDGPHRLKPPFNACIVAGTQAAETEADANELVIMRWEGLSRTRNPDDSDASDSDREDDDPSPEDDAALLFRAIPHKGGVNRVRARIPGDVSTGPPVPPEPYHVATFAETGKVHIFDVAPHLHSLLSPATADMSLLSKTPLHTVNAHGRAEGFALAWAPPIGASSNSARLLSGDTHSKIHLTSASESGFTTSNQPFASHTSSVEDLQWSPTEATVFASCSADRSVRIWDVRVKDRKSVLAVEGAHDSDVNVLSWNGGATYLLLTGGDEGGLKVWDMRGMKSARGATAPKPVAAFSWHQAPITSVEWHPTEDSAFVAGSADDTVTLWDLSVELDEEERPIAAGDKIRDVPAQLLFVHQGQKDVKEVHWHSQIPGMVFSTAESGFDSFRTISI